MGIETHAFGINASGQIVGSYLEKTATQNFKLHGFLYINGLYAIFDHPSTAHWTAPAGINANGHIVGGYTNGSGRGFLYINGFFASIDFPSASSTGANGINNNDQIVGTYLDN